MLCLWSVKLLMVVLIGTENTNYRETFCPGSSVIISSQHLPAKTKKLIIKTHILKDVNDERKNWLTAKIHTFDSLIRPDMCSIWKQKEKQITDRTSLSFSLLKWWGTSTVVDAHVSQEEFPSISSWERFRKINSIHKSTLWDRIQYNSKIIWAFKSRRQTYCVWIWLKPVFVQRRTRKYKDLGPGNKCSKAYCNATVTCFVCKAKPSVSLPVLWKRVRWLGWGFVPAGCHTAWPGECW